MNNVNNNENLFVSTANRIFLLATVVFIGTMISLGQEPTATPSPAPAPAPTAPAPFVNSLKGVTLGMTPDEVRDKLGKPEASDETGMYYSLSKNESAQIGLNPQGKVRTIALIYSNDDSDAPKFEDIFGPDVVNPTKKDGTAYKLVRYPAAGFWIAYSRILANKKPLTTITMRRIPR